MSSKEIRMAECRDMWLLRVCNDHFLASHSIMTRGITLVNGVFSVVLGQKRPSTVARLVANTWGADKELLMERWSGP